MPSWSFETGNPPFVESQSPVPSSSDNPNNVTISYDIVDAESYVRINSIDAYVNGVHAFTGPSTFIAPYDGPSSSITFVPGGSVDGYDAYRVVIDYSGSFVGGSTVTVRSIADDYGYNTNDESFTFGIATIVTSLVDLETGLYEITMDVTFDTEMLQDQNLTNPANYHFEGYGTYARKVEILSPYQVRLWVELFYGQDDFVLSIDPAIKNTDGRSLLPEADSYGISPFKSDATFTNYNAMVRTWHESTIVLNDSQRIYLAGVKGIDVFRKELSTRFSRWGQIFDEYGIDSMYVANFPSDLEITDEVPPRLIDQVPLPSSFAAADTRISFKVRDDITAVEITTLRIYIDGTLAFSGGYGGWQEGWNGIIEIEHHQLSVEMWADSLFDTGSIVTVRIVAQDLMGNEMDETYNFSILIPIGGFGGVPFGGAPFGGA